MNQNQGQGQETTNHLTRYEGQEAADKVDEVSKVLAIGRGQEISIVDPDPEFLARSYSK